MRVNEVLNAKAIQAVITISPDATVRDLITLLSQHNVGALVVSSDGTHLDGIVSERDVVRRLNEDPGVLDRHVHSIMSTDVHTCGGDERAEELMSLMTDQRIRHVPVLSGVTVVGLISIGDMVKTRISQLEFERDQLEGYVHST